MLVTISNNIVISEPSKQVIEYCKKELELTNPDYANKVRMGLWVGKTPKTLKLYTSNGDDLILPFGCLVDILSLTQRNEVKTAFHEPTKALYGNVELYDYQQEAVKQMINAKYGILSSKAGSGKTQMGLALVDYYKVKTLWLTHTKDLLNQSKERAERYFDTKGFGTITEGKINIGNSITFATVQTLANCDLETLKHTWDLIIVDEVHRVCGTPSSVTQFYKVINSLSARHKYGLSATVHRSDGLIKAAFALVGDVKYTVPDEAIADKVMTVKIEGIDTGVGLSYECLNTDGTLNYTKLISYLASNQQRNKLIAELVDNEPTLILSDRLEHLENIMALLGREDAVMISGKMTTKKGKALRDKAIEDMRTGKKNILLATYSLAKEGLDIPRLSRLIMATPHKDFAVVTQSIGRIARVYEGKSQPIVYDLVDNIPYLIKSFKKRMTIYRKNKCEV